MACLAIGLPAVHAQQAQDNRAPAAGASQPSSSQAGDQDKSQAAPRQGRSSGQATQGGSSGNDQKRAGDDNRQRGTAGARGQDDDTSRGRAERSKSTEQPGERSREQRRDARDRSQRDEARDERRDRADQERSRNNRDRASDRDRDRANRDRDRNRDRADRDRDRDRAADRERDSADRDRDRDRDRADRNRDRDQADRGRDRDRDRADRDRGRDRDRADRRQDSRRDFSFSQEQRTRISARFSDRIDRLNVRPLSRSRISVSIGVVVPSSIRLYDVPAEIVEIYPGFRGHKFVVVEDEIVIIEPRTRKIVTTISRDGGSRAVSRETRSTTGAATAGARVRFRPEQIETIRTVVMREPACRHELRLDFTIGLPLPRSVEICEFPDAVFASVPEARQYRYMVRGDDIVIVDPDEHRIVHVID
jgi:hypothetical protein